MKIIEVENLSKKYTIRHQTQGRYLTLRHSRMSSPSVIPECLYRESTFFDFTSDP